MSPKTNTEIFVNVTDYETRVAVVEDGKLVELITERPENERIVGDIYKGKVTAVLPGIQAAFVDIGLEKAGFLHFSDTTVFRGSKNLLFDLDYLDEETMDTPLVSKRRRSTSITDFIKKGQEILVQVTKEPMGSKGARLTSLISLPGRYIVMIPGGSRIGISKKISNNDEKKRLRKIVTEFRPPNFGIIVRTVAEGKDKKEFKVDTTMLTGLWDKMKKKVEETRAPALVHKDLDVTGGLIRDLLSPDVGKVMIDRRREFQEVNKYLKALDPKLRSIVELYDDAEPIFDKMGIENEIEKMFNRRVWLRGGAYLVIDQTEALVTIDINTGRFSGKVRGEDAIYRTNLSAAREIARQIRLRDIGGIIIIDFIDMEDRERRRRVYEELKRSLARDRSENYISSISDLGLVEMTRKRVGPSYMHSISDPCPVCDGVGRVLSRESMAVKIERWFKRARSASPLKHYHLITNSQVGELLLEGKPSRLHILQKNINLKVDLIIDTSYDPDEFSVFDASSEIDVTDRYTSREQP